MLKIDAKRDMVITDDIKTTIRYNRAYLGGKQNWRWRLWECYQATLPRIFFFSERRRFDSTICAFVPRERLAFLRRSLEASANCASFFASAASLIFCSSLRRAVSLFIACERESETVTLNPVGI